MPPEADPIVTALRLFLEVFKREFAYKSVSYKKVYFWNYFCIWKLLTEIWRSYTETEKLVYPMKWNQLLFLKLSTIKKCA